MTRHEDPVRAQRPLYALADPYLQAKLPLFAGSIGQELAQYALDRPDVEIIDLPRLYRGA